MKTSKWLKWKIGLFSTIGLAILFHEVKVDPSFDIAVAKASNTQQDTPPPIALQQDPITNELDSSLRNNRQNSQYDSSSQSSSGSSSNTMSSGRSHTRTTRS